MGHDLRGARGADRGRLRRHGPDPGQRGAWIAELDGERVGCVFCVRGDEPGVGQLRILLVTRTPGGAASGTRLVATASGSPGRRLRADAAVDQPSAGRRAPRLPRGTASS